MDTWIRDTSYPTDLNTKKKLFVSYLSIIWIMTHWIQGNNRILTITRITWITSFIFISCLDLFWLSFPKSSVNGILQTQMTKTQNLQNLKFILKIWQTLKKIFHDKSQFSKSFLGIDSWGFLAISEDRYTTKWLLTSFFLVC